MCVVTNERIQYLIDNLDMKFHVNAVNGLVSFIGATELNKDFCVPYIDIRNSDRDTWNSKITELTYILNNRKANLLKDIGI